MISCLSEDLKKILAEKLKDPGDLAKLKALKGCDAGDIGFSKRKKRDGGEKRAPSAYNQFIGQCMKKKNIKGFGQAGPAMKECAVEWNRQKGKV